MNMRSKLVMASAVAALLAGTGIATAQVADNPPGSQFQDQGNREDSGIPVSANYQAARTPEPTPIRRDRSVWNRAVAIIRATSATGRSRATIYATSVEVTMRSEGGRLSPPFFFSFLYRSTLASRHHQYQPT